MHGLFSIIQRDVKVHNHESNSHLKEQNISIYIDPGCKQMLF